MKTAVLLSSLLFAVSQPAVARAQELVANGGFEDNTGGGGRPAGNPILVQPIPLAVPSLFTGWLANGLSTSIGNSAYLLPPNSGGFDAAFGQVGATGSLFQDLVTIPGQQYTLSFFLALDSGGNGGSGLNFTATWDGVPVYSRVDDGSTVILNYVQYTFKVTASSGTTRLEFIGQNDPAFYFLDDVSVRPDVVAVPEPGTWAAAALAAGLVIRRVRRGKRA